MHGLRKVKALDLDLVDATADEVCDHLAALAGGERPAGGPRLVFTPNADHLVRLETDVAFRRAYDAADFAVPDGAPLVLACRLLGRPVRARVTGTDILMGLAARCARAGLPIFLLGGREGVAALAAERLAAASPGLAVKGTHHGYFAEDDEAVDAVARAEPEVLFCALGAPRQERFLAENRARLAASVAIAIGGAIDVAAGLRRRAPPLMGRLGLEWLFRLAQEPRRLWRRYLVDDVRAIPIIWRAVRAARR